MVHSIAGLMFAGPSVAGNVSYLVIIDNGNTKIQEVSKEVKQ